MNLFDGLVVVIVLVSAIVGFRSGALTQALGLMGAAGGVALIVVAGPLAQPILDNYDQPLRAILALGGAFLAVIGGDAIGSTVGSLLAREARGTPLVAVDRVGGALFGFLQGVIIAWLIGGLVATGPFPSLAGQATRSTAVRAMLAVLPPPNVVLGDVGTLLDESGLPDVFVGLEPPPAPAVGLPDQDQARDIGAAAIGSSVRVQSQACDRLLIGSGFAVRPDYVITNAHVVAGAEQTTVELDASGARSPADVVFFDPQLDVALLHVPGLNVPGLPFAVSAPDRGTLAAALGHPQGAQLTIVPAAVTAEIRARGRDLYGRDIVVRSIIELRSSIQPGDSGGPLVLPDGTVGGVIFADSRSDPEVGYALDPTAVAVDIQPAVGGATAVPVGPCLP